MSDVVYTFSLEKLENYIPVHNIYDFLGITLEEIKDQIYPIYSDWLSELERTTYYHIGRVKYFIKNDSIDPINIHEINIDGTPPILTICDGSHRYLAKILKKSKFIQARYIGEGKLISNIF